MKLTIWILACVLGCALPIGAMWYGLVRHRRTISLGSRVTPRWLNEHAYDHDGDRP